MHEKYNTGLVGLAGVALLGLSAVTAQAESIPAFGVMSTNGPVLTNAEALKSPWTASIAAGMTLTKGNTDTVIGNAQAEAERRSGPNDLKLGADLDYGENSGVKNTELYRGFFQYDRMFTERFYTSARVEGMRDGIADIRYRVILSPGIGYYIYRKNNNFLRAEMGPGYILERRGDESDRYATMRVNERGEFYLSKNTKLWESMEVLPQVDDFKNLIINSEIGIDVGINVRWSLRTFVQDSFNNVPAVGRDQNDIKLVTGIAYKFK